MWLEDIEVELKKLKRITPSDIYLQQRVFTELEAAGRAMGLTMLAECTKSGLTILDQLSEIKSGLSLKPLTVEAADYSKSN